MLSLNFWQTPVKGSELLLHQDGLVGHLAPLKTSMDISGPPKGP